MYEVAFIADFRIENWIIIEEALLNSPDGCCYSYRLRLVRSRGLTQWFKSFFTSERDYFLLLEEEDRTAESRAGRNRRYFQLFKGIEEEQGRIAFEGVRDFFKIVLAEGEDPVTLELIRELIKPSGPISFERAVEVLVEYGYSTPVHHEDILRHSSQSRVRRSAVINGFGNPLHAKEGTLDASKNSKRAKNTLRTIVENGGEVTTGRLVLQEVASTTDTGGDEELYLAAKLGDEEHIKNVLPNSMTKGFWVQMADFQEMERLRVQNVQGHTPLSIAASQGHLSVVVTLLLVDANPNTWNTTSGNTPLHYAAEKGFVDIVKALLVFGARKNIKNRKGYTPHGLATEHPKVLECLQDVVPVDCDPLIDEQLDTSGPSLLSLDGGGIRGLVSCMLLMELEDSISEIDPHFRTLADYFDWLSGTSTGSYLTLCMAYGKKRAKDIIKLYLYLKDKVLTLPKPFDESLVEETMKEVFGEDKCLSEISKPKVMITTCKADVSPPILHIMQNTGEAEDNEKGPSERKLWEAARASSAAPTYFPVFDKKFIDGGLMANNPTVDSISRIIDDLVKEKKPPRLGLVMSVGTGDTPPSVMSNMDIPGINWRNPKDIIDAAVGMKNFLTLVLDQVTHSGGQQEKRSASWCTSMNCPFFRMNPPLGKIDFLETDNAILIDMMFESMLYAKKMKPTFDHIAEALVNKKRN